MPDINLTFLTLKGAEIAKEFEQLAALRITVFHDYPYLYEGTVSYEKEYLKIYAGSPDSMLFAVYDKKQLVGATTCIPLKDETDDLKAPFLRAGFDVAKIFYFGESILLPSYRGTGLGHRFFDERENHAAHFGKYSLTCFCAVERGIDHAARPFNYRPNDVFWEKRGYKKDPSLQTHMTWLDIGETEETPKPMIFWTRSLLR